MDITNRCSLPQQCKARNTLREKTKRLLHAGRFVTINGVINSKIYANEEIQEIISNKNMKQRDIFYQSKGKSIDINHKIERGGNLLLFKKNYTNNITNNFIQLKVIDLYNALYNNVLSKLQYFNIFKQKDTFCCRHYSLAWIQGKLHIKDVKNIYEFTAKNHDFFNNFDYWEEYYNKIYQITEDKINEHITSLSSEDLKKIRSKLLSQSNDKTISTEELYQNISTTKSYLSTARYSRALFLQEIPLKTTFELDNTTYKAYSLSVNSFSSLLSEICLDIYSKAEEIQNKFIFLTNNHVMGLIIFKKHDAIKLKFYDCNNTLVFKTGYLAPAKIDEIQLDQLISEDNLYLYDISDGDFDSDRLHTILLIQFDAN